MLKHKITSIIMGALMLSGVVLSGVAIYNVKITNDNTKVINKVLLAASSSLVGERAVVVNTDNSPLVLYSNASSSSNITSYISVGEMLTIESTGDNFYKVKVQETGAVGYISAHNIQIITSGVNDTYSTVNKEGYIINVSSRVNLRANATMSSNILAKLSNNTRINVLGKQGQWYKVNCNGTVGYIYQEYVGISNKVTLESRGKNNNSNISKVSNIYKSNSGKTNNVTKGSKVNSISNIDQKVITNADIQNGKYYFALSKEANNYSVNENILNEKIYSLVKDKIKNTGVFIPSKEQYNIIYNGTQEEKQKLLSKYGPDKLVISAGNTSLDVNVHPGVFWNNKFLYEFHVVTLSNLIKAPYTSGYNGCITTDFKLANKEKFNKAVENREAYTLGLPNPSWTDYLQI
ncbi:SH3 domain-containing protein [Clostridium mediterraneense]|uniref:SH3 domain-containing protein n=1 Tax=Clostridium mediterraneense TaxID=1805472 RepID=UPI00082F275A|nr:SH3 domain-containing protein [Clostridium mediterraneense]